MIKIMFISLKTRICPNPQTRVDVGFVRTLSKRHINIYRDKKFKLLSFRVFFNQHFFLSALDLFNESLESVAFGNVNDGFQTFLS